ASQALDALAAFVRAGFRVPSAPTLDAAESASGRDLFLDLGCAECHGGPAWTRSRLPGEVGTLAPDGEVQVVEALVDVATFVEGEDVLGCNGFDVPSLLGLHASAPYLHDGSAASLDVVLTNEAHVGRRLTSDEVAELVRFLIGIDERTVAFD